MRVACVQQGRGFGERESSGLRENLDVTTRDPAVLAVMARKLPGRRLDPTQPSAGKLAAEEAACFPPHLRFFF